MSPNTNILKQIYSSIVANRTRQVLFGIFCLALLFFLVQFWFSHQEEAAATEARIEAINSHQYDPL